MNIQRPSGQYEYWHQLWASQTPVELDGKMWIVATVNCGDVCNIKLTEA